MNESDKIKVCLEKYYCNVELIRDLVRKDSPLKRKSSHVTHTINIQNKSIQPAIISVIKFH